MAKKFSDNAKALREKMERENAGVKQKENRGLKGEAQEFSKNAKRLAEKMQPAQPTLDEMPTQEEAYVGLRKDFNAKIYAEANIIPQIDSLIDQHKDGSGIPKSEIETTFKDVINQMVQDNILTREEMEAYLAPSKVEQEVQVDTGRTKMVPKEEEDRGIGNRILNIFSGNEVEMEKVKIFETKKTIVNGPSQLRQDIDSSMEFNDDGKLESPNLQSFKDKLMNGLSKICNSLGLKGLAKACRQSISKGNLEKTYKAEAGLSNLTSKVAEQAKAIGKAGTPEAKRVGERTQDILAKRQQPKNSGHSR